MWTSTLTLTVLADLLYHPTWPIGSKLRQAGPSTCLLCLFRKFVDTPGVIEITAVVRLNKRAHNPLLKEAGLMRPTQKAVPWLGGERCVHLMCP